MTVVGDVRVGLLGCGNVFALNIALDQRIFELQRDQSFLTFFLRDRFGARYVFTDNSHDDFSENANASGWFEIVYEDRDCTIFHIRDQKVEPEPEESDTVETPAEEGLSPEVVPSPNR